MLWQCVKSTMEFWWLVEQLRVLGSGEWQEQLNMLPSHTTQCRLSMYNRYICTLYNICTSTTMYNMLNMYNIFTTPPSNTTQYRLSLYNIFVQYASKSLLPLVRLSMHRVCTICKVVLLLPSCNQATKVFTQTERLLFFGPTWNTLFFFYCDSPGLWFRTSQLIRYCFAKRLMAKIESAFKSFQIQSAFRNTQLCNKPNQSDLFSTLWHFSPFKPYFLIAHDTHYPTNHSPITHQTHTKPPNPPNLTFSPPYHTLH